MPAAVRSQALDWLKAAGKTDADSLKSFDTIWANDRPLLEKVAETLALGDAEAKQLITNAHDPRSSAPTETPKFIKDSKLPAFYRANLALAYAKGIDVLVPLPGDRQMYADALGIAGGGMATWKRQSCESVSAPSPAVSTSRPW